MSRLLQLFTKLMIPLIVVISTWYSSNIHWGKQQWKYIIMSDGKGYYAYLPAIFIYDDLNFGFHDTIEKKYYDEHSKYDYRSKAHGKLLDKYFSGVALLQSPFFLAGHACAKISGAPADGYSKPYAIAVNLAAIFWLTIGLLCLRKLLLQFGASRVTATFVLFCIFFGTNLFYYTIGEPTMSHVYSFALTSIFFLYSKKWLDTSRRKYLLLTALSLGFIVAVRPVNGLVLLWLPFAAGSFRALFVSFGSTLRKPQAILAAAILAAIPVAVQLVLYYIATGHFFVDAYGKEGFHFSQPEMLNFLFSYKKGLFVYVPLTFVALAGFIPLWQKDRFRAISLFSCLVLIIYILSCWWQWYYGGSFGPRVMVEYYPLFALLLVFLLGGIQRRPVKIAVVSLLVILVIFCQFQTLQYRYELIHWQEMTREKYWDVFLQLPHRK
jgi:MFS family permease